MICRLRKSEFCCKDNQHVGSTCILTIKAKSIIDIAVALFKKKDLLSMGAELRKNGVYYDLAPV